MKKRSFWTASFPAILAIGLMAYLTACEVDIGDPAAPSSSGGDNTPAPTPTPGGGGTPTPGGGGSTTNTPGGLDAPGVPALLSPGNGESFSGSGKKVTFVWTDAEGAAQFEIVVQGLASGGWQQAAHQVTENFQFNLTLNSQPYTQFRWAVRSIGTDSQTSPYTGWSSFTWTP